MLDIIHEGRCELGRILRAGSDDRELRIRPADPLPATSTIAVRVGSSGNCGTPATDIADVAGNALVTCDDTTTFTTGN